jgi:hypothetical protein
MDDVSISNIGFKFAGRIAPFYLKRLYDCFGSEAEARPGQSGTKSLGSANGHKRTFSRPLEVPSEGVPFATVRPAISLPRDGARARCRANPAQVTFARCLS